MIRVDRNSGGSLFVQSDHSQFLEEFDRTPNQRYVRTRNRREFLLSKLLEGVDYEGVKDILHRLIPEDALLWKRELEKYLRILPDIRLLA